VVGPESTASCATSTAKDHCAPSQRPIDRDARLEREIRLAEHVCRMERPFDPWIPRHRMRGTDDAIGRYALERRERQSHCVAAKEDEDDLAARVAETTKNCAREWLP